MKENLEKLNKLLPKQLQKDLISFEKDLFQSLITELNSIELNGCYHLMMRSPFSTQFDELFSICDVSQNHRVELISRLYRILLDERQVSLKVQEEIISHYIKRATKGKMIGFQLNYKQFEHLIFKFFNVFEP